ncbi:MAG: amidase [Pseudonocardia sp. SCN 72-86]|nr:MAG: amidase [Pseudonocardia sp. SCN 72-86]
MVALLRSGDVTPIDALDALAERIDAVDGLVNALPIRFLDAAYEEASRWRPSGATGTLLAGLPVAIKDYSDVAGQVTSHGFRGTAHRRAVADDAVVARVRAAGGIPYAKTNVPELAGGHTYNEVWGATRNPWHLGRSAGGSSGGSAAALASGTAWLATGGDLGGSLRTPTGWTGTVGLRPTAGTIARGRVAVPSDVLNVEGPMGRDVRDTALLLDAMAGAHPCDPLSREPGESYRAWVDRRPGPFLVGFSADLGIVPIDPEVRRLTTDALRHVVAAGGEVTDEHPDFTGADDTARTLRAHLFATLHEDLLRTERDLLKTDIVRNVEHGLGLSSADVRRAERDRGALVARVAAFFTHHDLLVCPTAPLPAFPVDHDWPREIAGTPLRSYVDWIAITHVVSLTGCPILALPCALTAAGTPIGLQLVGPPRSEGRLLTIGRRIEESVGIARTLPIEPRPG